MPASLLLALASLAASAAPPLAFDSLGDVLPMGAVSRMGTTRWRSNDYVRTLAFAPNGKSIVSAAGETLQSREAGTGRSIRSVTIRELWVTDLRYSKDGKELAASGFGQKNECVSCLLDGNTGEIRKRLSGP